MTIFSNLFKLLKNNIDLSSLYVYCICRVLSYSMMTTPREWLSLANLTGWGSPFFVFCCPGRDSFWKKTKTKNLKSKIVFFLCFYLSFSFLGRFLLKNTKIYIIIFFLKIKNKRKAEKYYYFVFTCLFLFGSRFFFKKQKQNISTPPQLH